MRSLGSVLDGELGALAHEEKRPTFECSSTQPLTAAFEEVPALISSVEAEEAVLRAVIEFVAETDAAKRAPEA